MVSYNFHERAETLLTGVDNDGGGPFWLRECLLAAINLRRDIFLELGFLHWVYRWLRQGLPGLSSAANIFDRSWRHGFC